MEKGLRVTDGQKSDDRLWGVWTFADKHHLNQTAQERGQRVKATSDQSLHKLFVLSKNPNNLHSPGLIQSIK